MRLPAASMRLLASSSFAVLIVISPPGVLMLTLPSLDDDPPGSPTMLMPRPGIARLVIAPSTIIATKPHTITTAV